MNFEDDFMFAPEVNEAYVEKFDRKVHWLNGSFKVHNDLMKMIADDQKRQLGWERAVYMLACDENGKPKYASEISASKFHEKVNHSWARVYGGLIMGIGEGDEQSTFDMEVDEQEKKSPKAKEVSNS